MKQKSQSIRLGLISVFAASALSAAGCSGGGSSGSGGSSVTPVKNAGAAVTKAMSTISNSAPQVKTATVVTSTWDILKSKAARFAAMILPKAFATTGSLSAIWGTSGTSPTLSTQVTLPNEFFGGDGSGVTSRTQDTFTVTSASATSGATYSNNGATFTVSSTITGSTTLVATHSSGSPGPNGTLTLVSGTGDATIAFSAVTQASQFTCDGTATYCPSPGTYYIINESLVDYVGQELNSTFKNTNGASVTIFGRLNSALAIGCTLGTLITDLDTDGLPTVGVHTVDFPSDTGATVYKSVSDGGCGMDSQMAGQSLSITFSAVTGSSSYTKSMSVNVGTSVTIYLGLDTTAGTFNFMQVENAIPDGRYAGSRTTLHMTGLNTTNGSKIAFEYVATASNCTAGTSSGNSLANCGTKNGLGTDGAVSSGYDSGSSSWQSGFEFHRGYIDQANDVAYLLSSNGSPGKSDGTVDATHVAQRVMLTASGKPLEISACSSSSCAQSIALSFGFVGEYGGTGSVTVGEAADTVNATNYNGCVTVNSLQATDDGTLGTCGVAGTNASGAQSTMDAIRNHYSADVITSLVNGTSATTPFPFTDGSDIYTAHLDF